MDKQASIRARGEGSLYQNAEGNWFGRIDLGRRDGKRLHKTVSAKTRSECERKLEDLKRGLTSWTITVSDDINKRVKEAARTERVSVSEWLKQAVEEKLNLRDPNTK